MNESKWVTQLFEGMTLQCATGNTYNEREELCVARWER